MKFNRAAPFLGPFSGPKKWTAGDVPHAMCRANAASFREIGPASGYMFRHGSRTLGAQNIVDGTYQGGFVRTDGALLFDGVIHQENEERERDRICSLYSSLRLFLLQSKQISWQYDHYDGFPS